jgi:LCP family protein required for cell wall assembly
MADTPDTPGTTGDPLVGPWDPIVEAGRRTHPFLRVLGVLGVLALVATTAVATTGVLLVQRAEASLTRVPVAQLDEVDDEETGVPTARSFLVVGSDAREGLSPDDLSELTLGAPGTFDGQRADTMIYVSVSADRETISLVSLPRDLLVRDHRDRPAKLTDTFAGGPDALIEVVQSNFGLPVNHYASISLNGFIEVVRTLGGVEICLEEPLVDPKSGADFEAGCQQMGPQDSLAYVRSRRGPRSDFERIDRQQRFIQSVVGDLVSARRLADPVQLFQLVDDVASNVETDEALTLNEMRRHADEARRVVSDGFPMTTVPAYNQRIDNLEFMIAYGPGARALFDDLREGRPIAERGSRSERGETLIAIWSGGRGEASSIVTRTLSFAGYVPGGAGSGPEGTDAGGTTVVYEVPGKTEQAAWVAATLGAEVRSLPPGVDAPQDADVVVAVGDDATS